MLPRSARTAPYSLARLVMTATLVVMLALSMFMPAKPGVPAANGMVVELRRFEPNKMVVLERIGPVIGNRRALTTTPVGDMPPAIVEIDRQLAFSAVERRETWSEPIAYWIAPAMAAFGLTGGVGMSPTPTVVEWLVSTALAAWAVLIWSRRLLRTRGTDL